jgi:hypothetical protein
MKESVVQAQITQYLLLKGIFHYRNNSGGFRDGNNHFYRFGAVGSPDIICVVEGRFIGVEVKAPGGKQSDNQISFQKRLEGAGGKYLLAHSLEDVIAGL